MNTTVEASDHLRFLASPIDGPTKLAINRAARAAGIAAGLAKRLWYGEARRIDAETMDRLRQAAALHRAAREQKALEEARHEYRTLDTRLSAIEAAIGLSPADLGGPSGP